MKDTKITSWKHCYPTGGIMSKGFYNNSLEHGKWEYYYPNGNLIAKTNYQNGKPNGLEEKYNSSGIVFKISYFI